MSATVQTSTGRRGLAGRLGPVRVDPRRIAALGRAEMVLLLRNRTATVTALLLPLATVGLFASLLEGNEHVTAGAFVATAMFGLLLLYVVYHNLVTTYVARREERVLKRLRTGTAPARTRRRCPSGWCARRFRSPRSCRLLGQAALLRR
ncbi:hypothetical protein [Plantactinospora sonchi]|uniref:Integral membrane protein n=1 Tax=Plantactinospora sonchi TaxID=1544735 RepID=A0ABU7S3I3_9ACTN